VFEVFKLFKLLKISKLIRLLGGGKIGEALLWSGDHAAARGPFPREGS
jgi:hypothetical protein